jgi:hypothetical protein
MSLASALVAALLRAASSTAPVDPEKEPFRTLETRLSGAVQAKNVAALLSARHLSRRDTLER